MAMHFRKTIEPWLGRENIEIALYHTEARSGSSSRLPITPAATLVLLSALRQINRFSLPMADGSSSIHVSHMSSVCNNVRFPTSFGSSAMVVSLLQIRASVTGHL
uniref:Uncharacterized protein n=1 Tax=Oryza nivara TaxID=4536 RepID=A0A679BD03_ORYNI|nr:hypothetical protein [Oryza sativa f. spontanea]